MSWPWNPGYGPLKVFRTDTDRSAIYDFLLTFHGNHGPIFDRFPGDFGQKSLPPPCILRPCGRGSLGIGYQRLMEVKKLVMGLPGRQRSLTISSAVWIQLIHQRDGRTPGDSKDRALLPYAERRAVKTGHKIPLNSACCFDRSRVKPFGHR